MKEKENPLKSSMKIFKGQKLKCEQTGRVHVVVDALMTHKPIKLPGGQVTGNVGGIVMQVIIHPNELSKFKEVKDEKPAPLVIGAKA